MTPPAPPFPIPGSTIGFPDVFGHAAPDKVLLIAVDRPSALSVSTCSGNTDFDTFLWLYDGLPHNSTLVGDSSDSTDCAVLFAEVPGPAAYYLVVDGATPGAMGYFEVTVSCAHIPIVAFAESCPYHYLSCGDVLVESNVGYPDYLGSSAGDRFFLVAVDRATTVTISTCSDLTTFRPFLSVYGPGMRPYGDAAGREAKDERREHGPEPYATSDGSGGECAVVVADLPTAGAFYVVVDGAEAGEEGTFELSVLCTQLPISKGPEDACGHQYATCSDTLLGTTRGWPSFTPTSGSGDRLYLVAVDRPVLLSVSTCGGRQQGGAGQFTNFAAHLWLYVDGPPTKEGKLMGDSTNSMGECAGE